jgi:amino acid transporter
LNWEIGERVDNAVWITVFLVLVVAFNMFPVRIFGELEYILGCFKLVFIIMLIVLMLCLSVMQRWCPPAFTSRVPS